MTMTRRPIRRRLALRVYLFAAGMLVFVGVAMVVIPRFGGSPAWLEPQATLLQGFIDRLAHTTAPEARVDDRVEDLAAAFERLGPRIQGQATLYDRDGRMLLSVVEPPVPGPDAGERAALRQARWTIAWQRILVRSDDGSLVAAYVPARPRFPWEFMGPFITIVLGTVLLASVWFARRMARPLAVLGDAARRFGAGESGARAELGRDDEFGALGRAFDDMAGQIERLLRSQRQLMADISHELRTPLARIRVALELAAEDPEAARDVLADVGRDLDEIDELIERTLILSRLDIAPPGTAVQAREVDLRSEITAAAADRFARLHDQRELRVTGVAAGALRCDPAQVRRALDNLLDNAVKYSEPPAPVQLEVNETPERLELRVIDRGRGMSAEELEHAFTPFWRADASRTRATGGVGLGLALARKIARAHQGDVELRSAPGEGTTALLWLPR
jgi:two-component system OmpR family sensor kinase